MKTHRSLRHAVIRTSESVRSASGRHGKPPTGTIHARAVRGILILALVLGSLGVVVAAASGHGNTGHSSAHQRAKLPPVTRTSPTKPGDFINSPWMY